MPNTYNELSNQDYFDLLVDQGMTDEEILKSQINKVLQLSGIYKIIHPLISNFNTGKTILWDKNLIEQLNNICGDLYSFLKSILLLPKTSQELPESQTIVKNPVKEDFQTLKTIRVLISIVDERNHNLQGKRYEFNIRNIEIAQEKEEKYWNNYLLANLTEQVISLEENINLTDERFDNSPLTPASNNNKTSTAQSSYESLRDLLLLDNSDDSDDIDDLEFNENEQLIFSRKKKNTQNDLSNKEIVDEIPSKSGNRKIILYKDQTYVTEEHKKEQTPVKAAVTASAPILPPPPPPPAPPAIKPALNALKINPVPFNEIIIVKKQDKINRTAKNIKIVREEDTIDVARNTALLEHSNNELKLTYYDSKNASFLIINLATYLSEQEQKSLIESIELKNKLSSDSSDDWSLISKKWTVKNQASKNESTLKPRVEISMAELQKIALEKKNRGFSSPTKNTQPHEKEPRPFVLKKTENPNHVMPPLKTGSPNKESSRQIEFDQNRNVVTPKKSTSTQNSETPEFIRKRNNMHSSRGVSSSKKTPEQKKNVLLNSPASPFSLSCQLNKINKASVKKESSPTSGPGTSIFVSPKKVEQNVENANTQPQSDKNIFGVTLRSTNKQALNKKLCV